MQQDQETTVSAVATSITKNQTNPKVGLGCRALLVTARHAHLSTDGGGTGKWRMAKKVPAFFHGIVPGAQQSKTVRKKYSNFVVRGSY